MEFSQLEYFVRVASSDTMLKAADSLNVSQSTLSMSIKKLEGELGTELFRKEGRRLALTPEGEIFLSGALRILNEADSLRRSVSRAYLARANTVTLATDAIDMGVELYISYTRLNPGATVNVLRPDRKTLQARLLSRQADMAITLEPIEESGLVESRLLFSEPMWLLTGTCGPAAGDGPIGIRELADETLITMGPGNSIRTLMESFFAQAGIRPRSILETGDQETMATTASRGLGVTFIPRCVRRRQERDSSPFLAQTCCRPMRESFCYRNVYLCSLRGRDFTPAQRRFRDFALAFAQRTAALERYPSAGEFDGAALKMISISPK